MAQATVVKKHNGGTIAQNKRARHDYFIEEKFEAGMSLQGWEVKIPTRWAYEPDGKLCHF